MKNISITPVLNGFIVGVGCQQLAYNNVDKLVLDLGAYLRDPNATEKRIIEQEGINKEHTLGTVGALPRAATVGEERGLVASADSRSR